MSARGATWAVFLSSCAAAPSTDPQLQAPLEPEETVAVSIPVRLRTEPDAPAGRLDQLVGLETRAVACLLADQLFPPPETPTADEVHLAVVEEPAPDAVAARPVEGDPLAFDVDLQLLFSGRRRAGSILPPRGRSATIRVPFVPLSNEQLEHHPCFAPPEPTTGNRRLDTPALAVSIGPGTRPDRAVDPGIGRGGTLEVDVFFAWDGPGSAYWRVREVYDQLRAQGFALPEGFEPMPEHEWFASYHYAVGPLVRRVHTGGRDLEVRVRLVYGRTGTDTDPHTEDGATWLESLFYESLATRDVVIYHERPDGRPWSGLRLVDPSVARPIPIEGFGQATLAPDRPQLLVFDGVDVHSVAAALADNRSKPDGVGLDVLVAGTPRGKRVGSQYLMWQVFGLLFGERAEPRRSLGALHLEAADVGLFAFVSRPGAGS